MTRTDLLTSLGGFATTVAARTSGIATPRRRRNGATGIYDMRISQAGQIDGLVVEATLSNLGYALSLFRPSFTCAALLIINRDYRVQLNATEEALIEAIAGLSPGGDTQTYNLRTCYAGQARGLVTSANLGNIAHTLLSDGANPSFTCAAILAMNQGYQSQVNSQENALIQAIAAL